MPTKRNFSQGRKILAILLTLFLATGLLCLNSPAVQAKGSLSPGDCVKNVLVYAQNSAGDEILISRLKVSDMLDYLNDHFETYGQVHNYSILDNYVTAVHQEAQGFTVNEFLEYAKSKSTLPNINDLGLTFQGDDSVAFWEIDGGAFDAADTYTYNSLYNITRYNFPALYANWNYNEPGYTNTSAIWASRQEEQVLLSITAYSQRYMISPLYGTGNYNMENYFDGQGLLDTAKTVRLMLPMTQSEFDNRTPTAMNSRYGNCYILFDPVNNPDFSLGEVAKPTYGVIDGDVDETDVYEAGYWYFTFSCDTEGAHIYYNDNSQSSYMPTALYTGEPVKMAKNGISPVSFKIRAVKEGCSDAGVQIVSSDMPEEDTEEIPDGADIWDGTTVDTSWYVGHENDDTYTISTGAALAGLADLVNAGEIVTDGEGTVVALNQDNDFAGKTINLGNNIHLNGKAWTPIGLYAGVRNPKSGTMECGWSYSFNGAFNGHGYMVSGLDSNMGEAGYNGLFGKVENASFSNLTVSGSVTSNMSPGSAGIAGFAQNTAFVNCVNKAKITDSNNGHQAGGIVGGINGGSITGCVNYGKISGASTAVGGIAGSTNVTINNCVNYGKVTGTTSSIGGIAGAGGTGGSASVIADCKNYGEITGTNDVGGILGNIGYRYSIENCMNAGRVNAINDSVGGILGYSGYGSNVAISNSLNLGAVSSFGENSSHRGTGGIAGFFSGEMTACVNYAAVQAENYAGGLAGLASYGLEMKITSSYNRGDVTITGSPGTAYSYCGSLAGFAGSTTPNSFNNNKVMISRCYDVSGGAVFGGLSPYTTFNISKVYYLTGGIEIGSDPAADCAGVDPRTTAQMKVPSFATSTLGGFFVDSAGGYPALYWQATAVSFDLTPAAAAATVKDSANNMIAANPDAGYTLNLGETYTYEVTAAGYLSKTGSFTVKGPQDIAMALNKDQIATEGPNQVILSWSGDPTNGQTVVWNDDSGAGLEVVQYVAADSYMDESSFSSGSSGQVNAASKSVGYGENAKTYYEAAMSGLAPETTYYYRAGSEDNWSEVKTFTTAPASASPSGQSFSFMYLGDVQHNTTAAAEYPVWGSLLAGAYASNPDIAFGLMGGDMVQSGSDMNDWKYFLSYGSDVFSKIPMMPTIGNHESNFIGGKAQFYLDILALPVNGPDGFEEEFYSFDYGTVHITVLNSWALSSEQNLDETRKAAVADWITTDLASAQDAKFRIVLLHHTAYALANDAVCDAVLAEWAPLLEAGGADLVLCGHQHVYSRSYPMSSGRIDYENGITYVMGNSGLKFYDTADTTHQEKTIYNTSTYQIFNVNGDTLSLSTYDSSGSLLDSWSASAQTGQLSGDVDGDSDVDLDDVDIVYQAVLDCEDFNSVMDINADGIIDMRDAQLVLKIYLSEAA